MNLNGADRHELFGSLETMPEYLALAFSGLTAEQALVGGPDGAFSPVEQVWHLADLELEGFQVRVNRLLSEAAPHLANFDGTAVAAVRNYRSRSLSDGLLAFTEARRQNLALLRTLDDESWSRTGTQEGVGTVSLGDVVRLLNQHDQEHRAEIDAWKRYQGSV